MRWENKILLLTLVTTLTLLFLFRKPVENLEKSPVPETFFVNQVNTAEFLFDGLRQIALFHYIFYVPDSLTIIRQPVRLTVKIINQEDPDVLKFYFFSSQNGEYYLAVNDRKPEENGVYFESDFAKTRLVELPDASAENELVFEAYAGIRSPEIRFNGLTYPLNPPEKIERIALNVYSNPDIHQMLLVDDIELASFEEEEPETSLTTLLNWQFNIAPRLFSLPRTLRLFHSSFSSVVAGFLFLYAIFILLSTAIRKLSAGFSNRYTSFEDNFILLIPLQMTILFTARTLFAIPVTSLFLTMICIAVICIYLMIRVSLSRNHLGPGVPPGSLRPAFKGLVLYIAVIVMISYSVIGNSTLPRVAVLSVYCLPPLILFLSIRYSPAYPVDSFLLALVQLPLFFLYRIFYIYPGFLIFMAAVFLPWVIWSVLYISRFGSPYRICLPLIAATFVPTGFVELVLRDNILAEATLNFEKHLDNFHWDFEKLTNLFGDKEKAATLEITEKQYPTKKPAGTYRIICIGSSSTFGMGWEVSDRNYPFHLGNYLNGGSEGGFEVINGGISGASLTMIAIYTEEVLMNLDPDLIILYFGANKDLLGLFEYYQGLKEIVEDHPHIDSNKEMWAALQLKSRSPLFIRSLLTLSRSRIFLLTNFLCNPRHSLKPASIFYNVEQIGSTVGHIVDVAVDNGSKILLIPELTLTDLLGGSGSHLYYDIFYDLEVGRSGEGVFHLNLFDYFDKTISSLPPHQAKSKILTDEMHMSDFGYRLLAEQIGVFILDKDLPSIR